MADADIRYIDPMFPIPEGMDPRVWATDPNPKSDADDSTVDGDGADTAVGDNDVTIIDSESSTDDAPAAPENITVAGQSLRRSSDGSIVVDVVLDVEDVYGISKYEFRVTKLG